MLNYNELDKFYIGTTYPILMNAGGMLLELGEENETLLYKINDEYYADVNKKGVVAQIIREGSVIDPSSSYVVSEDSLVQVKTKDEIKNNSGMIKRLSFKSSNYKHI